MVQHLAIMSIVPSLNFSKKSAVGYDYTYQVRRDKFDKILADKCEQLGAKIYYQTSVVEINDCGDYMELVTESTQTSSKHTVQADFVLDASGFGRVLPRLLDLELPSDVPVRQSLFCHVTDNITDEGFNRNKILISVHPENRSVWYWLIPFADGISSVGVVAEPEFIEKFGLDNEKNYV